MASKKLFATAILMFSLLLVLGNLLKLLTNICVCYLIIMRYAFRDNIYLFDVGIDNIEGLKCGYITTDGCYAPRDCYNTLCPPHGFRTDTCVVFDNHTICRN